jgi:hypothetical protein
MWPEHMAEELDLSCGSEILTAGLRACRCLILYPFSFKVVWRNSNSRRLSLSHRALVLCSKVARTASLLERW